MAVPEHGRYVRHPAITDEQGIVAIPADVPHPLPAMLLGLGLGAAAGVALATTIQHKNRR